jgi:hypothetical protein
VSEAVTGGCQCGAVRYRLAGELSNPHLCHCRMCQKAFGSFFAPLVGVTLADFALTRGTLSIFSSSDQADRGFCSHCGTPLSFSYRGSGRISISIGSLDHPERVQPRMQVGIEARLPYVAHLHEIEDGDTTEDSDADMAAKIRATSHQHPDHDTDTWPPLNAGRTA